MNHLALGKYLIGRRREQVLREKRALHLEQRLQGCRGARWVYRFWPEGLVAIVGHFRRSPAAYASRR